MEIPLTRKGADATLRRLGLRLCGAVNMRPVSSWLRRRFLPKPRGDDA
jgi:hypothetical protein